MRRAFDGEAAGLGGSGVMQLGVLFAGGLFSCVLPWNLYRFHLFDLSILIDDVKVLTKDQFEDNQWMMVAFFVEAAAFSHTEWLPNRRQLFVLEGLRDQRGR